MKAEKQKKVVLKEELPSWNLGIAYYSGIDDPEIDEDVEQIKRVIKNLKRYKGKLEDLTPNEFAIFVMLYERLIDLINKLFRFANLVSSVDQNNQKITSFSSIIEAKLDDDLDDVHFIYYELARMSWEQKSELLNSPKLRAYIPWMQRVFVGNPYADELADWIQEKKSKTQENWGRLYSETCSAMKFKLGDKTYNAAEIYNLHHSTTDKDVYEASSKEMQRVYKELAQTFTLIFNTILKDEDIDAKLNGCYNAEELSSYTNVVPREHLLEMVSATCDSFYPLSRRFYGILDKLHKNKKCFPVNNPIKIPQKTYSWEECKEIVFGAYENFSSNYADVAKTIVNSGVVDVAPKEGKKSGAFCMSGKVPYIFLNFTGIIEDLNTFAHELGHAVNHCLAAQEGILNDRTPLSLAEVTSEFAEYLLFDYLFNKARKENDSMTMLYLLIGRASDVIGTIHRQVAIYNFEKRAHKERQDGEISTDRLCQIWAEEYERYTGKKLEGDDRYSWMYIPHIFESPFYVYNYAFAGFIVNNLIDTYIEDDLENNEIIDFSNRFILFLKNTGIEFYSDLLDAFEIDVDDPDFWKTGLKHVEDIVDSIEDLAKELKLL